MYLIFVFAMACVTDPTPRSLPEGGAALLARESGSLVARCADAAHYTVNGPDVLLSGVDGDDLVVIFEQPDHFLLVAHDAPGRREAILSAGRCEMEPVQWEQRTGRVVDAAGAPIPNVSARVYGHCVESSEQSDSNGVLKVTVPANIGCRVLFHEIGLSGWLLGTAEATDDFEVVLRAGFFRIDASRVLGQSERLKAACIRLAATPESRAATRPICDSLVLDPKT